MKLWIDDLRDAPHADWYIAKTSRDAIDILEHNNYEPIEEISFDHDLGGDDTARPVMLWMIENNVWPDCIFIHTANPVGSDWLYGMATRYAPNGTEVAK